MTGIQWTEQVWNPTTGCDKVSPGCGLPRFEGDDTGGCYAMAMAKRLKGMGKAKYQNDGDPRTSGPGFGIAEHPDALTIPFSWRKPRKVFVNSMSDLFHDGVSDEFIARVFAVMAATPEHTYQLLTKRHGRMRSLMHLRGLRFEGMVAEQAMRLGLDVQPKPGTPMPWPLPNLWLGVSVEDQKRADLRIPALLDTPAAVRFLSCEPLLGPVDLSSGDGVERNWLPDLDPGGDDSWYADPTVVCCGHGMPYPCGQGCAHIDWVIVGGESGPAAREMDVRWACSLVQECQSAEVPVFVKQFGSAIGPGKGGDPDLWPADLRVREFPAVVSR